MVTGRTLGRYTAVVDWICLGRRMLQFYIRAYSMTTENESAMV